jgi:hypothetical protein
MRRRDRTGTGRSDGFACGARPTSASTASTAAAPCPADAGPCTSHFLFFDKSTMTTSVPRHGAESVVRNLPERTEVNGGASHVPNRRPHGRRAGPLNSRRPGWVRLAVGTALGWRTSSRNPDTALANCSGCSESPHGAPGTCDRTSCRNFSPIGTRLHHSRYPNPTGASSIRRFTTTVAGPRRVAG